jgi:hypothetical protein
MDTRFWGPSGWKLLHLISFDYTYSAEHAILYAAFFETIPYILPCKFCRSSLTDYYKEHPFQLANRAMNPTLNLKKWMYTIHNCVSNKLRKQGISTAANPTYAHVVKQYEAIRQTPWEAQLAACWDFLFSVAYHYPTYIKAEPMKGCPSHIDRDSCEMNKWNVLPVKQRMTWYRRFWSLLPDVLPSEIRYHWQRVKIRPDLTSRTSTLAWLWKMRCALDPYFKDPYTSVCKMIRTYSSDCAHAITCRARRKQYTKKK